VSSLGLHAPKLAIREHLASLNKTSTVISPPSLIKTKLTSN
jgi:hypothetical protein